MMARGLKFRIKELQRYCTIYVAKTEALISSTVTAQLICAFVFAYTKSRFSHGLAQMMKLKVAYQLFCKVCLCFKLFSLYLGSEPTVMLICAFFRIPT